MKIKTGDKIPDFEFITSNKEKTKIMDIVNKNENTLLLFLRYYGCTICQLDLTEYKKKHADFKDLNTEVVIVLQSIPATIMESGADIPYIIACDPKKELYKAFEISPAKSMLGMLSFKTITKGMKASKEGLKHGKYEGDELQLPAAFLINKSGIVKYSRYAKSVADIPNADEFLTMIK
jgi:Peroxiredoxin